mmetsp:Transcript_11440/g.32479  ORF Transcript_11440/g.32479 Transcript_11440/m.32479 type:complete len:276 (-) Transcript_11440:211-1038(-)
MRCHVGCFHGMVLGLVVDNSPAQPTDDAQQKTLLQSVFHSLCNNTGVLEVYGTGECLHAAGHTATILATEHGMGDPDRICLDAYAGDPTSQHYCGTGAFMQLKPRIESCADTHLPGACFLYAWRREKIVSGMRRSEPPSAVIAWAISMLKERCGGMEDSPVHHLGCVFGLAANTAERIGLTEHGAELTEHLVQHSVNAVRRLCLPLKGEAIAACVEGFVLRNQKYFPERAAEAICGSLADSYSGPGSGAYSAGECRRAAELLQYSFDRNVGRYVS